MAALGAVPKELGSEKVRMIHDGSYSVDVNRRIKVRDREIEEEVSKTKEARFSLLYDISRAHKLVPIAEEDWGLYRPSSFQARRTRYTSTHVELSEWPPRLTTGSELQPAW